MTGALRVVRAGAGSGKTYELCEDTAKRVVAGLDPARILATTFTTKAAAELKGRIQARLLAENSLSPSDRVAKAERLELAAIGTVHSVGHHLLRRYALRMGLSPTLDVLDDGGRDHTLKLLLSQTPKEKWRELIDLSCRLSLGKPQDLALTLLNEKRSNRISQEDFRQHLKESAEELLALMAPEGSEKKGMPFSELYDLAMAAHNAINAIDDDQKNTAKCKQDLNEFATSKKNVWADFIKAGKFVAGKKSNGCLEDLRAASQRVYSHPDIHQDIAGLLTQLGEATLRLEDEYQVFKSERGLVDFTDLEVLFLELLEADDLAESLQADFDFVAVDEFQDTNPLQLAIFQKLRAFAKESSWIGDSKQAIYGFRGTDPELVANVWDRAVADRLQLDTNYRSQKGLVQFVGEVFTPIFGDEVMLNSKHASKKDGLERWILKTTNNKKDFQALAGGIEKLRDEGVLLRDIAVLVRTGDGADGIASACQQHGIPVLLPKPGLLATREGALVFSALRLAADGSDSLAAATILHILSDPKADTYSWINERLKALNAQAVHVNDEKTQRERWIPWANNKLLGRLRAIDHSNLPPSMTLQEVIQILGIGDKIRAWGSVAQRASNLDALRALAEAFEDESHGFGSAATLTGFIAWLESLAENENDMTNPPYGIDAVTILTYHKSKGLEWPVVILASLDYARDADLWKPEVTGISDDPTAPLAKRHLRYWPWPFEIDRYNRPLKCELWESAMATPEGKDATRRNDEESLRLLYVGMTRAKDKLIFAHRGGECKWLDRLEKVKELLPDGSEQGSFAVNGIDTNCVVRHLDAEDDLGMVQNNPEKIQWLESLGVLDESEPHVDRYFAPSASIASTNNPVLTSDSISNQIFAVQGGERDTEHDCPDDPIDIGNAVHAFFASWPSLSALPRNQKECVAERCLKGFGVEDRIKPSDLVTMGENFENWVSRNYNGAAWNTEVNITAPRAAGGQWDGHIDLLLRLPDGGLVVIDHKASATDAKKAKKIALHYAGQMEAYRQALYAHGCAPSATLLHFPFAATMIELKPM